MKNQDSDNFLGQVSDAQLDVFIKTIGGSLVDTQLEEDSGYHDLITKLKDINRHQEPNKHLTLDIPQTIGPYEIVELIGQGGMGQVFKVRHKQLGNLQVLKVLHDRRAGDSHAQARFQKEISAIGKLSHPNIVSALHADEFEGTQFLVMDLVEGFSLSKLIADSKKENKKIPISAACELVRQACEGINYAHQQGIIHRDVKPANLMVDRSGTVKILDLGLARINSTNEDSENDPELTINNQIIGTPDYMAPEQLKCSKNIDARADVFSLGATLYCLLCGGPPFGKTNQDENILEQALGRLNDEPKPIRQVRPDVPKKLEALIQLSLHPETQQRPDSAMDLGTQLAEWADRNALNQIDSVEILANQTTQKNSHAKKTNIETSLPIRSNTMAWATTIVALILVAGILFNFNWSGETTPDENDAENQVAISSPIFGAGLSLVNTPGNEPFEFEKRPRFAMEESNNHFLKFDASPNGQLVAYASGAYCSIFELGSERVLAHLKTPPGMNYWSDVKFSKHKDLVAMISKNPHSHEQILELRDRSGHLKKRWHFKPSHSANVQPQIEWGPNGTHILISDDLTLRVVKHDGNEIAFKQLSSKESVVFDATFHPDGKQIFTFENDGIIRLYSVNDLQPANWLDLNAREMGLYGGKLDVCPVGRNVIVIANGEKSNKTQIVSLTDKSQVAVSNTPINIEFAWSPDGGYLVDGSGIVFDLEMKVKRTIKEFGLCIPIWTSTSQILTATVQGEKTIRQISPLGNITHQNRLPIPLPIASAIADEKEELTCSYVVDPSRTPVFHKYSKNGQGRPFRTNNLSPEFGEHSRTHQVIFADQRTAFYDNRSYWKILDNDENLLREYKDIDYRASLSPTGLNFVYFDKEKKEIRIDNVLDSRTRTVDSVSNCGHFSFSPRGSFFANSAVISNDNSNPAIIVWSTDSGKRVFEFSSNVVGETHFSFSDDEKYLAVVHGDENDQTVVIKLVDLEKKTFIDYKQTQIQGTRCRPFWSSDSKRLFARHLFNVTDDGKLTKIANCNVEVEFGCFGKDHRALAVGCHWNDKNEPKNGVFVFGSDGELISKTELTSDETQVFIQNVGNGQIAKRREEFNSKSFILAARKGHDFETIVCFDPNTFEIVWHAMAFDDGETITFDKNGKILDGPQTSGYLIDVIRYPGGRCVPISKSEIKRRNNASLSQRAIFWAFDQQAVMKSKNGSVIQDLESQNPSRSAHEVGQLLLKDLIEISDSELSYLKQFQNLSQLNVTNCNISQIPNLEKIQSLQLITVSNCPLKVLGKLPAGLMSLSLANTDVSSTGLAQLLELQDLEHLDLRGTTIDDLFARELISLKNLKTLDLRNTAIPKATIEILSNQLPDCEVLSD